MHNQLITCTKCNIPLPKQSYNTFDLSDCPSCNALIRVDVFPALLREQKTDQAGADELFDNESGCFFHPQKKAVTPCAICGRFLCSMCDIDFNGQHVCPACIDTGKKKKKLKNLETHRTLYDNISLVLATIPLLIFYITFITAPISLFIALRHWKSPSSIIPRTKVRFILAIFFSALQITGWIILFVYLFKKVF